jgi:prephenate dehydrogenase
LEVGRWQLRGGAPRLAIVGHGLIGGSIELAVRQRRLYIDVIAIDRGDPLSIVADAELIVLAAPITENIAILRQLPDVLTGDALITDTGSAKRTIMNAARELPTRLRFIGGHPIAGAVTSGSAAASPDLFSGAKWILTPALDTPRLALLELSDFVGSIGATPVEMTAEDHDRVLAHVSHLPQLATSALMNTVGEAVGEEALRLAGRGLRDSTRLAHSGPTIWRDILEANADNIDAALDRLIAILQDLRQHHDRLPAVFERASHWKRALDASEPR